MNSLNNNLKFLRLLSIKRSLNTLKEITPITPIVIKQVKEPRLLSAPKTNLLFSPRVVGVNIEDIKHEPKIKDDPIFYVPIINPRSILPLIEDEWLREEIGLPSVQKEKVQAARLIVIRKRKMRIHKRRKLAKRMKYKWARIRQKRRQIKEKHYQAELLAMIKQAEDFSAEQYVTEKLDKANYIPPPSPWKELMKQKLALGKFGHKFEY